MSADHSREQSDMLTLQEAISRAAPTPPDGLQTRVGARILRSAAPAAQGRQGSTRRRFTMGRAAALLLGMLIVGTGVVFAISTALQQFITQDDGLAAITAQGCGHEIGLSQTIDGFTVTLDWAYADGNRMTLAYTIQAPQNSQYVTLSGHHRLTLRDSGLDVPMWMGMNGVVDTNGEFFKAGQNPISDRSISVNTYDLSTFPIDGRDVLDLRLEMPVYAVTADQHAVLHDPARTERWTHEEYVALVDGPDGVFAFDFTLPLDGEQRILNTPLTATDNDITLTLQRVVVTPSQVRFVLCLVPPAPDRKWTAIPHLAANGGDVAGGGAVSDIANVGEAANQSCMQYLYNAGMYDYRGEWRLEITELVGFGSGGGNDQQRIAGSWVFEFTVP